MTVGSGPVRALAVAAALFACHQDAAQVGADEAAGSAASGDLVFDHYAPLKRDAVKVDVSAFGSGDVALAKGRRIAPVLYAARVDWAKEERALGEENEEAKHLLRRLASPRAPYCPNNTIALCDGHPWFAADPATAGVIVYVEQRTAQDGAYVVADGPTGANAYRTTLEFDAVLIPEKLRVARWWRLALPPQSQLATGAASVIMMIGRQTPETFEDDMQKLFAGVAPVGDLQSDPWHADATAPAEHPSAASRHVAP